MKSLQRLPVVAMLALGLGLSGSVAFAAPGPPAWLVVDIPQTTDGPCLFSAPDAAADTLVLRCPYRVARPSFPAEPDGVRYRPVATFAPLPASP